jgi:hypothetical protein
VPYGTSYWQVGDSSEQNGCFKMALTKHKRDLLARKALVDEEFAIEKDNVTYLVSQAWEDLFARIRTNKNAIAERGWTPLNYNCLLHPEIMATKHTAEARDGDFQPASDQEQERDSTTIVNNDLHTAGLTRMIVSPDLLNLSQGLSCTLINSIIESKTRSDARNGVNAEEIRLKRKESALESIRLRKKRYSAGGHVAAGRWKLGPDLLAEIRERENLRDEIESRKREKRRADFRALLDKVNGIRVLGRSPEELNVQQLKTMVTWYKIGTDSPIPQTRQLLLERLRQTSSRHDPVEPAYPRLNSTTVPYELAERGSVGLAVPTSLSGNQ